MAHVPDRFDHRGGTDVRDVGYTSPVFMVLYRIRSPGGSDSGMATVWARMGDVVGWLTRVLGKRDRQLGSPPGACLHASLMTRWPDAGDVPTSVNAGGYTCIDCDETFTPDEAKALGAPPAA